LRIQGFKEMPDINLYKKTNTGEYNIKEGNIDYEIRLEKSKNIKSDLKTIRPLKLMGGLYEF
jgi:hypothetical protein